MNYWISLGALPSKLVVGMAAYGRGFILSDPQEDYLGAPVAGPSPRESVTREPGMLSYYEVSQVLWNLDNML